MPLTVREPNDAVCPKTLVDEATVEKKAVEVAFTRVVLPLTVSDPTFAVCPKRFVELAVVAKKEEVVAFPEMKALPATAKVAAGEVVPMPNEVPVKRATSARMPDWRVENARSPFAFCGTPPVPPWKMEKMDAVEVPVLCVVSSVRKARPIWVEEVAEPKLER